jgi:ribose transport system substrate-binding protein
MFKSIARIFSIALAAAVAAGSAGARDLGGVDDSTLPPYKQKIDGKKVMWLPMGLNFDLAYPWVGVVKRDLEAQGIKFSVRDPNWDPNVGAQALTEMIADKPDVIIVHNPDVQSYAKLLKKAMSQGIFVIQVNMRSTQNTDAYVGVNWINMGHLYADAAVDVCKGKSNKIAIMQGAPSAATSLQTLKGIEQALANHPDVDVVSLQAANWETGKAKSIAQVVLKQNPDLCAYIGFNDLQDAGIAAAVKEAGLTGKVGVITSGGGEQKACDLINDGSFDTYILYNAATQGADISALTRWFLASNAKPGESTSAVYTRLTPLTKSEAAKPGACWHLDEFPVK